MLTSENIELALEAFNDVRCSGSEPVRYETPRTLESFVCDRAPEHLTAASQIHPVLAYPVMLGPNISGEFGYMRNDVDIYKHANGAFSTASAGRGYTGQDSTTGFMWTFSADRSSSKYGLTATVQPASLFFLPCIRF